MTPGTIVVAGALVQKPSHGGHSWVLLQYLLGFKRLGWDVLFLDQIDSVQGLAASGQPWAPTASLPVRRFLEILRGFDLEGSFALSLTGAGEPSWVGLSRPEVIERTRRSALLLNVMGFLTDREILAAAPRRVFLDIDPGFGQMWRELGLHDLFGGHDQFVSIGENIGQPNCTIPTCGLNWITTPQPVVLERWPVIEPAARERFTTVGSWRGAYGPVEYAGRTYGLRVHEFRKFASLPRRSPYVFEVALEIHPAEVNDLTLLAENGWLLANPKIVAGDPWAYQGYIQQSRAEFMVAKNMYVDTRSGWFSDRSLCYLASGKPVLAQDTGFGHHYPTGEGLLTFRTLEEAQAGVEEICGNYPRHARAARGLAEAYFDSDKVLSQLLGRLGVA